jgi:HAD superfamily hydrolase (TIGR01509 family)
MSLPVSLVALGRPAGVVFDCDGLLVDTEPSWEDAEAAMFARRGLGLSADLRAGFIGISSMDAAAKMAALFDEPGTEATLYDELLAAVTGLIERQAAAMPGALAVVAAVRAAGVPVAVASNSPERIVRAALQRAGLADAFDAVVPVESVGRPKPAPDLYLEACRRLGTSPERTVAFEDSVTGLASARGAGLAVVGVPSLAGDYPADWVLESLTEVAVGEWIASW